jgi:hypothetical protein
MWKGKQSFHALLGCAIIHPGISMCLAIWKLSKSCPSGLWWRLHYMCTIDPLTIGDQLNLKPSLPRDWGVGLKVPTF